MSESNEGTGKALFVKQSIHLDDEDDSWQEQMELDKKIESFAQLCMSDPFSVKSGFDEPLDAAKLLKFKDDVYPRDGKSSKLLEALFKGDGYETVKCIFIPSREIVRSMVQCLVKYGNSESPTAFLLRFCLLEK